ncbi:uncharacterized protein B0P05DRAFT_575191 [Gilbertella persicaria]|uniref:uncharacterized protein n=1 Tax=Gilbertella persicaria TaxID=101096 RepID=UPI00221EE26C|nr:uncharacterized protein B0P05DRAFT_575191 [Gilbertella persicaria]KAI8056502.1 hypothetical protein B0P05DRAFT_575191 [Gilbertella persicaria]
MLRLNSFFSKRGLLWLAILSLFYWLLRDYPNWRAKRQNNAPQNNTTTKDQDKPSSKDKVSLVHYILVSPFAAFYIIVRIMLDTIRYSLYYFLWSCEKSIPYIDDWLYDFCTKILPYKYSQTKAWWMTVGKPKYIQYKQYTRGHLVPATIHGLEVSFITLYKAGCILKTEWMGFVGAWHRFIQRYDWHQLVLDLSNIGYRTCWVPFTWIVSRSYRLCFVIYTGLHSTATSIIQEIQWVLTVALPSMYHYMASTRLAKVISVAFILIKQYVQWTCFSISQYVLKPTIGRCLVWTVKVIDKIISLLQQNTIQEKLTKYYRLLAPSMVWVLNDLSSLIKDIISAALVLYSQLVLPAYRLFIKHIIPRLSIAYKSMTHRLYQWLESYLYPVWSQLSPYLNKPLYWIYLSAHTVLSVLQKHLTQQLVNQIWTLCSRLFGLVSIYTLRSYEITQPWLIEQAPRLANLIQQLLISIKSMCDWQSLSKDLTTLINILYDWIAEQSNLIYLSLERSLTNWAKEQHEIREQKLA